MTNFYSQLRAHLKHGGAAESEIETILSDIRELREAGAKMGEPGDLAEQILEASKPETSQWRAFHTGGPADRRRAYDMENPRLITPRVFGIGAGINIGALAVKLGLLRPDDLDDEVIAAIPASVWTALKVIPVAMTGVTAVAGASARARGKQIPASISPTGQIRSSMGPLGPAVMAGASAALAFATIASTGQTRDSLARASLASALATLIAGMTVGAHARSDNHISPLVPLASVAGGLLAQTATFVAPVRSGLARVALPRAGRAHRAEPGLS